MNEEEKEDLRIRKKVKEYEAETILRIENILKYIEKEKTEAKKKNFLIWVDMKYSLESGVKEIENDLSYLKRRLENM